MKPHELENATRRRFAAGLVGGAATLAVGVAPVFHSDVTLVDVGVDVIDSVGETVDGDSVVTKLVVMVANGMKRQLEPVFTTWDQRRRTRHTWEIEAGPATVQPSDLATYELSAPTDEAVLHWGLRAQLTVYQHGEERWTTVHFTPEQFTDE